MIKICEDGRSSNVRKRVVGALFAAAAFIFAIAYITYAFCNIKTIISECKSIYYCLDYNFINRQTDDDFQKCFERLKWSCHSFADNILSKPLLYNKCRAGLIDVYGLCVRTIDLYKPDPNIQAVKLLNNQLSFYWRDDVDVDDYSHALIDFKKYLENRNIGFVYVQIPHKTCKYQPELPPSIVDYSNQIFDRFIHNIENDASVIDMRDYFKSSPEEHYKLFYPGDGHWKPMYAFITAQQIMKFLHENYSCIIDPKVNNLDNYEVVIEKNKCNDISKRLGRFYYNSNIERQQYLVPRFDTFMTINSDSVDLEMIKYESVDYKGPYNSRLLFQIRPKMNVRNTKALNNNKVMILGDSFSPPVMSFLSLCFTDIEYHALNCYDGDIFEEIEKFKPDMVILLLTARIVDIRIPGQPTPSTERYFEMLTPPTEKE